MTWVAVGISLALAAGGAAVSYNNTRRTARNTDNALADQIRNQSVKQREADAKVNETVGELEGSTAADERTKRLDDYMQTLRTSKGGLESGLTPAIGSAAFRADAAGDAQDVQKYAGDTAGLMARIDSAGLQRQGEAFSYGKLGTDLGLIGREARGRNWLDDLRVRRASQRNAGMDALSALLSGAGSAVASGSGGAAGSASASGTSGGNAFFNAGGLGGLGY